MRKELMAERKLGFRRWWGGLLVAVVSGSGAWGMLVNPTLDYRVSSSASLGDVQDDDVVDERLTGFGSVLEFTSANVAGGASATARMNYTVTPTSVVGVMVSTLSVSEGAGSGNGQAELDFELELPTVLGWSGTASGISVGDATSVFLGQQFPTVELVNESGQSLNLGVLEPNPRVLEPGSYRLTLTAGSETVRDGAMLLTPTGRSTFTFAISFEEAGGAGDYDDSGSVEQGDLDLVLNNWGLARPFGSNGEPFATLNVDQEELDRVLNNWGTSSEPNLAGVGVPEPGAAVLMGGLALLGFRVRGRWPSMGR